MKRKMLKDSTAFQTTKKNRQIEMGELALNNDQRIDLQSQMLNWRGIAAAIAFSVPFVVTVAINLQSGAAITLVLAAVLLPTSMLAFCLREKLDFPPWLTAPLCTLVAAGITAFAAVVIRHYFPQVSDAMGMYLYLVAAYPVAAAVFYEQKARSLVTTLVWTLRNIIYFGIFAVLAGVIREFFAYNTFAGIHIELNLTMEGAKSAFFGFIVMAFLLAGAALMRMIGVGRLQQPDNADIEEFSTIGEDEISSTGEVQK